MWKKNLSHINRSKDLRIKEVIACLCSKMWLEPINGDKNQSIVVSM